MSTNYPHRTDQTLMSKSDAFVSAFDLTRRAVVDGRPGGQYGWAANTFEYVSSQPHVQQQAWCIILSTPALFSRLPGGQQLHSLCKSFFENRTRRFEGLSDRTEINFGEMKWTGHTMSMPVGATRSLGTITHTAYDVEGESFTKMFKTWSQWCLMDPETGYPKAVTLRDPGDLMLDEISASAIYFEPSRNFRDVTHAQLVVGIMPRSTVPIEMRRDKDEDGQIREISMEFTGLIESDTWAAKQIARRMMSQMQLYNSDGREAPPGFMDRTATVKSLTESGTIERSITEARKVAQPNYMG